MREESEGTPLLRGRPGGGLQSEEDPAFQQPAAEAIHEDDAGVTSSRTSSSSISSSNRRYPCRFVAFVTGDPRSFPLLLAVAAVSIGVLVLTIGFMSTSGGVGERASDVNLPATTTTARSSTIAPGGSNGGATAGAAGAGGGARNGGLRYIEGDGAGDDGGSKAESGGWRSQAERSPGMNTAAQHVVAEAHVIRVFTTMVCVQLE